MLLDSLVLSNLILLGTASIAGLYGAIQATWILRGWDPDSNSATQLNLEKRNHLITSVVRLVLFAEIVGTALFLLTASSLSNNLQGAMCAFGSLNSNDYGFPALGIKTVGVFAFGYWLTLDSLDRKVRGHPLVLTKYRGFLLVLPIVLADAAATGLYFYNLNPQVVTSCCSTAFAAATGFDDAFRGVLEPIQVFAAFILLSLALPVERRLGLDSGKISPLFSLTALAAFGTGAASMTLFVAPHVYEAIHFCPFDLLLQEHSYVGYPMYLALFAGGVYGLFPGGLQVFSTHVNKELIETQEKAAHRSTLATLLLATTSILLVAKYYFTKGVLIV